MKTRILGYFLISLSIGIFIVIIYTNSYRARVPVVFSVRDLLSSTWQTYKASYIEPTSGRPIDTERNDVTTSEGVSYMLLRSVWMDDKPTFDTTLSWAESNLKRPNDSLFSWLYGQRQNGTYGILTDQNGQNTASDADTDIALALIFAANRWGDPSYLATAQKMIGDIWKDDIVSINGVPYMSADNVEKNNTQSIVVNPSYLSPYSYRIFSALDPAHPWLALVTSSYSVLDQSTGMLTASSSAALPPDWLTISRMNGTIIPSADPSLDTDYSYDALRTPWRIALDYQWYGDPRAKQYLDQLSFLGDQWNASGKLYSEYDHAGDILSYNESPAMYGGSIGYFLVSDPDAAKNVYANKLAYLYNSDANDWKQQLSYYDANWAWFGIALYAHMLPNLATATSSRPVTASK